MSEEARSEIKVRDRVRLRSVRFTRSVNPPPSAKGAYVSLQEVFPHPARKQDEDVIELVQHTGVTVVRITSAKSGTYSEIPMHQVLDYIPWQEMHDALEEQKPIDKAAADAKQSAFEKDMQALSRKRKP